MIRLIGTKVECRDVGFMYDGEERPVLHQLSFTVQPGEWTAVIGASGSGKSTLCQLLSGLLPRSGGGTREGVLLLDGMDPASAPLADVTEAMGVLFQDPDAQLVQGIVEDEAAFGPENLRVAPEEIERRIVASLTAVDLLDRRSDPVRSLSGGQRQRTAIAAVLALQPRLYVFDDACASLDAAAQARFLQLCEALQGEGRTLITASGRFDDAARAAQRVIVLDGGTVVLDGPPEELLRRCGEQLAQLGLLPRPAGEAAGGAAARGAVAPQVARGGAAPPIAAPVTAPAEDAAGMQGAASQSASAAPTTAAAPNAPAAAPAARPPEPLLELRSLHYSYPGGREALSPVDAVLEARSWALLTGENGSGKTTLSRLIMGLLPAPKESILWRGEDLTGIPVHRRAERIGYVFQQPEYMFTAPNVWEELVYSLHGGLSAAKRPKLTDAERSRANHLLETAGLAKRLHMSPYLLSQGEKRLLSLISQMILARPLYILDEPTSGMDYAAMERIVQLCRFVIDEGAAILMITHDPDIMRPYADSVIHLRGRNQEESVHIPKQHL
ncbi:energy-coupling factor ABC transporter ATP-binding protein [Paenibacillus lactis]|uniref:ABC transporter ATP-binding protein n=1 Tax=Paenibacillus lactis TaxID=228574 RepID=UPI00203FFA3B|nr:ABC transporter ATP-binding protein [Paenibacillus lactis]MCM3494006.1 energy-coupling factor ABC transporter ATP-binding protein [Paenibacillus lactis]